MKDAAMCAAQCFEQHMQVCGVCQAKANDMCITGYQLMEAFIDEIYFAMVGGQRRKGGDN